MDNLDIGQREEQRLRIGLQKVDYFASLNSTDFEALVDKIQLRSYDAGTYLFKQGDRADALYMILEGEVDVKVRNGMIARAEVVETLMPGSVFGETAVLDSAPRSASVQAATPVKLFVLERTEVDNLLQQSLTFRQIISSLSQSRKFLNGRRAA